METFFFSQIGSKYFLYAGNFILFIIIIIFFFFEKVWSRPEKLKNNFLVFSRYIPFLSLINC